MREIVLDTETTGFEPEEGHRIIEIGCIELVNQIPTGENFHQYINPERDVPEESVRVHGLTEEYLKDFPVFKKIAKDFVDFVGDAKLVIHNAAFDMKFLNAELKWAGLDLLPMEQSLDTLAIARKKFPGSPASLDALCRRFEIDNTERVLHGALLDAELLSEVYLELLGGRQRGLELKAEGGGKIQNAASFESNIKQQDRPHRVFKANDDELAAHQEMIKALEGAVWEKAE